MQRDLRILKRVNAVPSIGVCTACNAQFEVPPPSLTTAKAGRANLLEQFEGHKCKREDVRENAVRIVREATKE